MRRRRFSERDVLATLLRQAPILCFRCKQPMEKAEDIEREHLCEIALGGEDAPHNCAYSHKWCHFAVTNGTKATTAGSSKQRIAKVKRLRGETKNKPKKRIPSRPFQKRKAA